MVRILDYAMGDMRYIILLLRLALAAWNDDEMSGREEVISWLTSGEEDSEKLLDLKWEIKEHENYFILENKEVPFKIHLLFVEETLQIFMRTEIETAVIDNEARLALYRTLLILNRQIDHVKFMLAGINEEVTLRVDLQMQYINKDKIEMAFNQLLTSLYIMAKALHIEEEFNQKVLEWMGRMIADFTKQGKTKKDIERILVNKIGISPEDASAIIGQVYPVSHSGEAEDRLYG